MQANFTPLPCKTVGFHSYLLGHTTDELYLMANVIQSPIQFVSVIYNDIHVFL